MQDSDTTNTVKADTTDEDLPTEVTQALTAADIPDPRVIHGNKDFVYVSVPDTHRDQAATVLTPYTHLNITSFPGRAVYAVFPSHAHRTAECLTVTTRADGADIPAEPANASKYRHHTIEQDTTVADIPKILSQLVYGDDAHDSRAPEITFIAIA